MIEWQIAYRDEEGCPVELGALLAEEEAPVPTVTDVVSEALEILQSLGYTRTEAQRMIDAALERLPKPSSVEELIRAVYQAQRERRE